MHPIFSRFQVPVILGDGGYLIELERRGYVESGSQREKVGTGKGSGQYTPEIAVENPEALRQLHAEFLGAGAQVLQALTFFGTREKLARAGYGDRTEEINRSAVQIAKSVAGGQALVAGTVSRTQLVEREGPRGLELAEGHLKEQVALLADAGVDLLILETFFHLAEMKLALSAAVATKLPVIATMSFRPKISACSDGFSPADCAKTMVDDGAIAVGANCEQDPVRMREILSLMRQVVSVPLAAQPAAFLTTDECHSYTRLPEFPNALETIQVSRDAFFDFGIDAKQMGIGFVGGCCGCNAAYIRALNRGLLSS